MRLLPLDPHQPPTSQYFLQHAQKRYLPISLAFFCFISGQPLEEVPSKCEPSTVCSTRPSLSSDLSSVGLFLPGHSTTPQPLGRRTYLKFYHLEPFFKISISICRTLLIFGSSILMLNTARYFVASLPIYVVVLNRFLSCAHFRHSLDHVDNRLGNTLGKK